MGTDQRITMRLNGDRGMVSLGKTAIFDTSTILVQNFDISRV